MAESLLDVWPVTYLVDNIFNNLMEGEEFESRGKINKYILQAQDTFKYIRIKSSAVKFYIHTKDLKEDTTNHINDDVKDCKTEAVAYRKLDGTITEVVSLIYNEARPLILSALLYEDPVWVQRSISEIRTVVSGKWRFV